MQDSITVERLTFSVIHNSEFSAIYLFGPCRNFSIKTAMSVSASCKSSTVMLPSSTHSQSVSSDASVCCLSLDESSLPLRVFVDAALPVTTVHLFTQDVGLFGILILGRFVVLWEWSIERFAHSCSGCVAF